MKVVYQTIPGVIVFCVWGLCLSGLTLANFELMFGRTHDMSSGYPLNDTFECDAEHSPRLWCYRREGFIGCIAIGYFLATVEACVVAIAVVALVCAKRKSKDAQKEYELKIFEEGLRSELVSID